MNSWKSETEINSSRKTLFSLINGTEENLKKILPNVVSHKLILETEDVVGSKYLQVYKENDEIMEYEIEIIEYIENRQFKIFFNIDNFFEITATYEAEDIKEGVILFKYTSTSKPLNKEAKAYLDANKYSERENDFIKNFMATIKRETELMEQKLQRTM